MRSLSVNTCFIYLDIFLYIVIHYRPVICSLNYFIYFYMARMSCYRRVINKFKYLKLQRFGIQDYHLLLCQVTTSPCTYIVLHSRDWHQASHSFTFYRFVWLGGAKPFTSHINSIIGYYRFHI
jgi:hypothetical protein